MKDSAINEAKKVLAYEVTKLVHSEADAQKAAEASEALFGAGGSLEHMPTTVLTQAQWVENPKIVDLMVLTGVAKSKGEARRLIEGGGVSVDDAKVTDIAAEPEAAALRKGIVLRKGKKVYHRIVLGE